MLKFALNDRLVDDDAPPGLPALDYLRETAQLRGVKHACREGDCGSCVVLLGRRVGISFDYRVVTSCLLPTAALHGHHVVTVEGLNRRALGPIQAAFVEEGASQCGFCTPGFIVSLTGHLLESKLWAEDEAIEAIAGNICRCTGYASIRRALSSVIDHLQQTVDPAEERIPALVREGFLPDYFLRVNDLFEGLEIRPPDGPPAASQVIVAGGTDLYVQKPSELPTADLWALPVETDTPIWRDGEHVYLAGTATAEDIKRSKILSESVPGIERSMRLMGSLPIRQRATIAGNIVNASPIGDMTIVFLSLDAELGLAKGDQRRLLPLHRFFLGYKELDLEAREIVEWVRFKAPAEDDLFNFEKVSKRTYLDIASVNTALRLKMVDGRIHSASLSAGGVAPIPALLPATSESLSGREPDAATARHAATQARKEITPISDVRGSAEYKRLLLGQLVLAHFYALFGVEASQVEEESA
ncbi:MAG: FAD binding domain-containing protein [Acidobacteria bacterium]|jgi:xanthine dehydrogenase small subunit|nr:FAD binding domain-containing protein [Acidobacteriota bacterium]